MDKTQLASLWGAIQWARLPPIALRDDGGLSDCGPYRDHLWTLSIFELDKRCGFTICCTLLQGDDRWACSCSSAGAEARLVDVDGPVGSLLQRAQHGRRDEFGDVTAVGPHVLDH